MIGGIAVIAGDLKAKTSPRINTDDTDQEEIVAIVRGWVIGPCRQKSTITLELRFIYP